MYSVAYIDNGYIYSYVAITETYYVDSLGLHK